MTAGDGCEVIVVMLSLLLFCRQCVFLNRKQNAEIIKTYCGAWSRPAQELFGCCCMTLSNIRSQNNLLYALSTIIFARIGKKNISLFGLECRDVVLNHLLMVLVRQSEESWSIWIFCSNIS